MTPFWIAGLCALVSTNVISLLLWKFAISDRDTAKVELGETERTNSILREHIRLIRSDIGESRFWRVVTPPGGAS